MQVPLFPLSVFPMPGEIIGLHVFEPRYQALFDQLERNLIHEFGIPFSTSSEMWRVGALMRLVTVKKREADGRRDVLVTCTRMFRLSEYHPSPDPSLFSTGTIDVYNDWATWPLGNGCKRALQALIDDMRRHNLPTESLENQGMVRVVQHLGISPQQKAEIFVQPTLGSRQDVLKEALEFARKIVAQRPHNSDGLFLN